MRSCRVCGVELTDENWAQSNQKDGSCICKECKKEYMRLYQERNRDKINAQQRLRRKDNPEKYKANWTTSNRNRGQLPMNKNKKCSSYLGVYKVERLLKHFFNDVVVMPYGNHGYDFVCNNGKKIDSKSGCILKNGNGWQFRINYNTTADYFWCVAFDNRKDLNIIHIWMLPGDKFNHLSAASISPSTLDKWAEYEQPLDKIMDCWNEMNGDE